MKIEVRITALEEQICKLDKKGLSHEK
jgi:hypothetical protein